MFWKKKIKTVSVYSLNFDNIKTLEDIIEAFKALNLHITTSNLSSVKRLDSFSSKGILIKETFEI